MVRHRFFGGSTPKGAMDFVPSLIHDIEKRYFIKGRPGSGKSEPEREGDQIVDMYQKTIRLGTDEDYEEKLHDIQVRYKKMVNQGIEFLQTAKKLYDELKSYYLKATDERIVNDITEDLIHRIDLLMKQYQ